MCYKKPGPRCSAHALKALSNAHKIWREAYTDIERSVAMKNLKEAKEQYYTTPVGQKGLKDRILYYGDPDGLLSARLERGIAKRKSMLEAIKSEDKGDVEEHTHVPEYTIVNATPVTLAGAEYSVQVQTQANGRQTVWLTGPRGGVFFLREYLRNDSGVRQVISYKSGQPLRVRGNEIHVTQTESVIEQVL